MAKFFIDRPIFAWVVALFIIVLGGIALTKLPIAQYPKVAPPAIVINTAYPGASAKVLEDSVLSVIEREMNGSPGLVYMESVAQADGTGSITISFEAGTNVDLAQVDVQNRLSRATPRLPASVTQQGVRVDKASSNFLLFIMLSSEDAKAYDTVALGDYASRNIVPEIQRVAGVGQAQLFGTEKAMRIWFDPAKLQGYKLSTEDVTAAIRSQNAQVASGAIGDLPNITGQKIAATVTVMGQLSSIGQFENIVLRANPDGSTVRLKDVATIEIGGQAYATSARLNGKDAVGIGVQLTPSGNALATAKAVHARMEELQKFFPKGVKYSIPYDSSKFVSISIEKVAHTLLEAIVLVFLVMYLFLQNIRATLIPSITVPVVLLGTFGIMSALGFTVNTLSMFGLVLAIGLLVDDAIVVVENVERVMHEDGLGPYEATEKAMGQITSALIGVALVLSAVFVPVAFSSGTVGAIYREFSLTVVASMLLSVFVALTLTPALCAMLLKRPDPDHHEKKGFFGWFNRSFDKSRDRYLGSVGSIIRRRGLWMTLYAVMIGVVLFLFLRLPGGFLPKEDQGYMFVQVQTPAGSTLETTGKVLDEISNYLLTDEKAMVESTFMTNGASQPQRGQNQGRLFVRLKPWDEREDDKLSVTALSERISARYANFQGAQITAVEPPAIRGLGSASGFSLQLQDRGNAGHEALAKARDQLLELTRKEPALGRVRYTGQADNATYKINIDREKAAALGVSLTDVDQTFSTAWGSRYVNNFFDTDNRIKRVYVQADAQFRMNPDDIKLLYVRNKAGDMVPFSAFATAQWSWGAPAMARYNGIESAEILGQPAPGHSTGEAMKIMERLVAQLPEGFGYEWSGISLQESQAGAQAPLLYALSILVVFLSLAALYESWSIPVSVIMVVPVGVLGALGAATMFGLENDVFFQVGLLTTIGLSAKNAILIVEFARELQIQGYSILDAAMESAKLRLRPIIMTSMAFVLGVLPLAIASGAGAASQNALGIGVIGGMLTATFVATFLIPLFFVLIAGKIKQRKPSEDGSPIAIAATPEAH